ncbi:MAG: ribonuclease M5 [Acidaminococcales bacterium]|jgi:ribonuclease M5|nr:ribonuclease M5 [Acidaminococcales bacterium]
MKAMLKEVIVVEGKNDRAAVLRALDAEVLITGGFSLNGAAMEKIRIAYEKRGIIILTDPDGAGERIRKKLTAKFPNAGQAFVAKEDATAAGDVGVERASAKTILAALAKTRTHTQAKGTLFSMADIFAHNLTGTENAAQRRAALGKALGIGYANAKVFLYRLNNYGIALKEFEQALAALKE